MILLASAIGQFFLYILLGIGALFVTALLDRSVGKERALFFYALALLALAFAMKPAPAKLGKAQARSENDVPAERLTGAVDPFRRPPFDFRVERNIFQKHSDTRKLPPIALTPPPWIELDFPLPPTIPGPAPAARRILRGELPKLTADDGTRMTEIPDAVFVEYEATPDDVYDWILTGGKKFYVYILGIQDGQGGPMVLENDPGFDRLKRHLAGRGPDWQKMTVKFAGVGFKNVAEKYLKPEDVLGRKLEGINPGLEADAHEQWFLRRTVDNLYVEALANAGVNRKLQKPLNLGALRRAAREMAAVGRTGKEDREGWRRAARLLEVALAEARGIASPGENADILRELLEAYAALRDEKSRLRALAEFARVNPDSPRPWSSLAEITRVGMGLPDLSKAYSEKALDESGSDEEAWLNLGDAEAYAGNHTEALRAYRKAGRSEQAEIRKALALLRLGQVAEAKSAAESVLARRPDALEAVLIRGAALYAQGDLATARSSFERVAASPDANEWRAQAAYDLGLTCIRLGQRDAALAAFLSAGRALERGSSPGPTPDETVSPSLGRAIVALAEGDLSTVRTELESARLEAPQNAYLEFFAGILALREGNTASAERALTQSLRRAPAYRELDGWLALTFLRLAQQQAATGAEAAVTAPTFRKAVAFAERAAMQEEKADKKAYHMRLRLALIQLAAEHVSSKQRYTAALETSRYVLQRLAPEQPAAEAILAYCHYGLGGEDNVDEALRRFRQAIQNVPEDENAPWREWREYAEARLAEVNHWYGLEEMTVTFEGSALSKDWKYYEGSGVRILIEDGRLSFSKEAKGDGSMQEPTVWLNTEELFTRSTFEEISLLIRIPRTKDGKNVNNITFGVQVLSSGRRGTGQPGIGIFYDKGKLAGRIGTGQVELFKDGKLHRLTGSGGEMREWPSSGWLRMRFRRVDAEKGVMEVSLGPADQPDEERVVLDDRLTSFKNTRGKAYLWIGGFGNRAEAFDVEIKDIRVIRDSSGR